MNRLIEIDPQSEQEPKLKGYEFGYYVFGNLANIEIYDIEMIINSVTDAETKDTTGNNCQGFPIDTNTLQELQHSDSFYKNIFSQIEKGNMQEGHLRDNILKRYMTEGDNIYETIVIPRALIGQILKLAHEDLGHNGTHRTYIMFKRLCKWKGLKPSVEKHIKTCDQCQRRNKQEVRYTSSILILPYAVYFYGFDRLVSPPYK